MRYNHFQIGCVIVEYDLFNTTNLIQNQAYARFGIILSPFYANFSRQEHNIGIVQNLSVFLNPIPAGVLENQDTLGGGQFDPPL